jgi:hypothetical protein
LISTLPTTTLFLGQSSISHRSVVDVDIYYCDEIRSSSVIWLVHGYSTGAQQVGHDSNTEAGCWRVTTTPRPWPRLRQILHRTGARHLQLQVNGPVPRLARPVAGRAVPSLQLQARPQYGGWPHALSVSVPPRSKRSRPAGIPSAQAAPAGPLQQGLTLSSLVSSHRM